LIRLRGAKKLSVIGLVLALVTATGFTHTASAVREHVIHVLRSEEALIRSRESMQQEAVLPCQAVEHVSLRWTTP
jgi:hypothetical protein